MQINGSVHFKIQFETDASTLFCNADARFSCEISDSLGKLQEESAVNGKTATNQHVYNCDNKLK